MQNKTRCAWCEKDDLYRNYHDHEWGNPVHDDHKMFEFLILETFQAGLSWYTILAKRENFRKAFDHFDFEKVSQFSEDKIQTLMLDAGIIRNQLKIRAAVSNAQAYIKVREEFGSFCTYIWNFIGGKPIDHQPKALKDIPASTPLSDALSKDLKKRGFKFVGTTVVYAHMQATGMVNDHIADCWKRNS
ncbi:DNA-3-methyladenine glycosylase I [Flavobacterium sp. CYK-55]|uniref:DNA-3-methyladenine glycosylase I n=1 Tax=Flavobacterium sp. CYK-55 TaxID=2835529 RepID=UPI001BCD2196|nr:DNA-3-methyladenine glycosylase I [Flavobacterium sp. CYK-55]MBS7785934.1 DNA-3-methyladenine glycosylase I [Flavobacterium sp. CYK-55]